MATGPKQFQKWQGNPVAETAEEVTDATKRRFEHISNQSRSTDQQAVAERQTRSSPNQTM